MNESRRQFIPAARRFCVKVFVAAAILVPIPLAAALPGRDAVKATSSRAGLSAESDVNILTLVGGIVNSLLGLLGVIFLLLTIYAGFLWMTASGNEENVTKAKGVLSTAVIGLVIVFSAYAISTFVFDRILTSTVAPG